MRYRHKQTGVEITVPCDIQGGEWEPVEAPTAPEAPAAKETKPKRSTRGGAK